MDRLQKWRLILGAASDKKGEFRLKGEHKGLDATLEALYDTDRKGGLGGSSPNVNRWLGDIRKYFPSSVVQMMQRDALERLNLERMLLEPELLESVEVDVHLVATLLSLKKTLPARTRETARKVVEKLVRELEEKLARPMQQAVRGALSRSIRNRRPRPSEINWHLTIRANLRHYQRDLKAIIPEQLIGFGRKGKNLSKIILVVDQSGSMASSVVYASVMGSVMASLQSLKTHLVLFDTSVVDMTAQLHDPVELLFGAQLGGGTDINKALTYASGLITNPTETIVVLISDLFEGGNGGR